MVQQRWVAGTVAVLLGLFVATASWADEAEAAKTVQMLGGKVTFGLNKQRNSVFGVILTKSKVTDKDLKVLREFKNLQTLALSETQITDEGLKELKEIKGLTLLDINYTQITDDGLRELQGLTKLKKLYVVKTKVTAAGINELKKALPKLQVQAK